MAYDFVTANDVNVPNSWNANKCAGKDCFTSFLKRNKAVSLRIPEVTSLYGAVGFTRPVANTKGCIFPLNKNVFEEHEFLLAEVTDIGQPTQVRSQNAQDQAQSGSSHYNQEESQPPYCHRD
ncbi:hypothetical protein ILUMI_21902 [Ignelater luminosus]|uniref:Uncharacterized protein n=1 Tax=Ignelater luminosus TaxID=2038154 RepID=A0A8K0G347_IGNLU|nr:hypothetical protein ILUMI_21902 [Ignelater luminosus]